MINNCNTHTFNYDCIKIHDITAILELFLENQQEPTNLKLDSSV